MTINYRKSLLLILIIAFAGSISSQAFNQPARSLSEFSHIFQQEQPPPVFDQYDDIRFNDEKARLDNFAIALQSEPSSTGYIVFYAGSNCNATEAKARASRARRYLVSTRGITPGRIVTVDGKYRNTLHIELFIVPIGGKPPTATPTSVRCTKKRPKHHDSH
jgi:hypothetical protein